MIHTPEMGQLRGAYPKLDLGCGPNKQAGFIGIDKIHFPGVDIVADLTKTPWPLADDSAEEVFSSHFLEHLEARQRVAFVNELYRVLKIGGRATIIVPHWASCRAYGDMTHKWPPVSEFWPWYLDRNWRAANAPHDDVAHTPDGYACDFEFVVGNAPNPALLVRAQEAAYFAMQWYKEAVTDLHISLKKR